MNVLWTTLFVKEITINWKKGACSLKNPEKSYGDCLHFEDEIDSLKMKAEAIFFSNRK
jgi:hypothetical protein